MKVSPINNTNQNFKSRIKLNNFFKEGMETAQRGIDRSEYKSLNEVKKIYDSLLKITSDKNVKEVVFDMNQETSEVFAIADGEKVLQLTKPSNVCTGYISTQAIKEYAKTLNIEDKPTILDSYKLEYEMIRKKLYEAHEKYRIQIETEINELVKDFTV